MQAVRICRAATEANISRCIFFLKRLFLSHLVRRFCETPSDYLVMQRRLKQTPYSVLTSRRRPGIRTQRGPDVE